MMKILVEIHCDGENAQENLEAYLQIKSQDKSLAVNGARITFKKPATKLVYRETGKEVKVGDKVPGKRLECYSTKIMAIHGECVELRYTGENSHITVSFDVIDAVVVYDVGLPEQKLTN